MDKTGNVTRARKDLTYALCGCKIPKGTPLVRVTDKGKAVPAHEWCARSLGTSKEKFDYAMFYLKRSKPVVTQ